MLEKQLEELADALADAVVSTNKGSDDEKVAQAIMAVEWLKRASADVAVQPSGKTPPMAKRTLAPKVRTTILRTAQS